MDVSENDGTPKSSILMGISIINHTFWGTPIFGNPHIYIYIFFFFENHQGGCCSAESGVDLLHSFETLFKWCANSGTVKHSSQDFKRWDVLPAIYEASCDSTLSSSKW